MNEGPWRVYDVARLQRERIQEEMREIRMVEAANRAQSPRLSWAARLSAQLSIVIEKWLRRARTPARGLAPQTKAALPSKYHARA